MLSPVSGGLAELAKAMAKAQAEMPVISLDKTVSFKNVNFEYASLSNIIHNTKPILAKNGLSILQFPSSQDGFVKVETMVLHTSGEYLTSVISARLPATKLDERGQPKPDDPKELGSLVSYLRRYAYGSVLGIALDGDYDATLIAEKYLGNPEQKVWLRDVLIPMGITDTALMSKVSAAMVSGNYEMTEDSVLKVLETLRK